jgi:hypothetical protein
MKNIFNLIILFFAVFTVNSKGYSQNNADPGISILMSPVSVSQGSTGTLSATVGNYGNDTIVANSLRVTISVGPNAEITGIAAGSDVRWSQLSLTTGSANTIQLKNTAGSFNPFDIEDIRLTVKGNVVNAAKTIVGNIVYISSPNPLLCGGCFSPPLNISQGNAGNANDNSETSLAVTGATLTFNNTQTNVLCYGGSTGTSTASVTGGTGGYTYSWNTTPIQTTATAIGLSVGSYVITVTDNTGSTGTATILITQPNLLVVSAPDVLLSNYGDSDGTSTAIVTGGTQPYTYSWNTTPVLQTTATANGLSVGSYVITVTDTAGCMAKDTIDVTQPLPSPNFTPTIDINSLVFVNVGDTADFIVNISNITSASSNGQIVVKIAIPSAFAITWNAASGNSTVVTQILNDNSDWLITQNGFFITMTLKTGVIIGASAYSAIGFSIARKLDVPTFTQQPLTATIVNGSGSDSQNYDNTSNTILKAE